MASPHGMQSSLADAGCPLLELPAELRDRIYRFVLPAHRKITVTASGFDIEGLVNTCSQIRGETLCIFYGEGLFQIQVPNWNSDALSSFTRHILDPQTLLGRLSDSNASVRYTVDFYTQRVLTPNWKNLLEWTRRVHQGAITRPGTSSEASARRGDSSIVTTVFAMMCTACELRDQPWSLAEQVSTHYRAILASLDGRWMIDA
ncbi:Hypothetical predicted protein [Lecanosticta acicola]|uniref:Uncharacterized protein n=1 Tax=Lecanosticta acicola TaxID=111012 RepID=A0AAI8YZY7_9PEZI|nr:Hypothetical predicted protein [Lecanosticta acicola]